jgi:hypothetical protein
LSLVKTRRISTMSTIAEFGFSVAGEAMLVNHRTLFARNIGT